MDNLFEQFAIISKASAYDVIAPELARVQEENKQLRDRVKFLESLIDEYTTKMTANLSGDKVDQFLNDQIKNNS